MQVLIEYREISRVLKKQNKPEQYKFLYKDIVNQFVPHWSLLKADVTGFVVEIPSEHFTKEKFQSQDIFVGNNKKFVICPRNNEYVVLFQ